MPVQGVCITQKGFYIFPSARHPSFGLVEAWYVERLLVLYSSRLVSCGFCVPVGELQKDTGYSVGRYRAVQALNNPFNHTLVHCNS